LVSELVSFCQKVAELAALWQGADAVENLAAAVRRISGPPDSDP
jgi:hypothetical protein